MYLISTEGYKNAGFDLLIIKKTDEIWTKMKDIVLKEIFAIYKTKGLPEE